MMKKTCIFSTLLVVTLAAGLLFVSCDTATANKSSSSSGGSDTTSTSGKYTQATFYLSSEGFTSVYGTPVPTSGNPRVITAAKADLAAKYNSAKTADGYIAGPSAPGLSYSDTETAIKNGAGVYLTDAKITECLNGLKSNGASAAAIGSDVIAVIYWYKE